ncbi:MAG: fibrobacter succinogenes major paralogous domain-containing protein [Bacteroidota bacterium]
MYRRIVDLILKFLAAAFLLVAATGCSKNDDIHYPLTTGTVADIDGNVYSTVIIGSQKWMVENLKSRHYRNGDPVTRVTDPVIWQNLAAGGYCYYGNDTANGKTYGLLYNWYSLNDPAHRLLAPSGWHIAGDEDWTALLNNLQRTNIPAYTLKAKTLWDSIAGNNNSGFAALPGGMRFEDGSYGNLGSDGYWWSCPTTGLPTLCYRHMGYRDFKVDSLTNGHKNRGFSVRCVHD